MFSISRQPQSTIMPAAFFKGNHSSFTVCVSEEGGNAKARKRFRVSAKGSGGEERRNNHKKRNQTTSHWKTPTSKLLQTQTEWIQRYPPSGPDSVCPPGSFWPTSEPNLHSPSHGMCMCVLACCSQSLPLNRAHLERGKAGARRSRIWIGALLFF